MEIFVYFRFRVFVIGFIVIKYANFIIEATH